MRIINAIHFIFQTKHSIININSICEFHGHFRVWAWSDDQTDWKTESINTFQHYWEIIDLIFLKSVKMFPNIDEELELLALLSMFLVRFTYQSLCYQLIVLKILMCNYAWMVYRSSLASIFFLTRFLEQRTRCQFQMIVWVNIVFVATPSRYFKMAMAIALAIEENNFLC